LRGSPRSFAAQKRLAQDDTELHHYRPSIVLLASDFGTFAAVGFASYNRLKKR
jgi:hypothetical protein